MRKTKLERTGESAAIEAIRHARGLGINLFDTTQGYGSRASERLLGRALREELDNRREEVVIATKGGLRPTDDGLARDASPAWLRAGLDAGLQGLGTDHVDVLPYAREHDIGVLVYGPLAHGLLTGTGAVTGAGPSPEAV